MKSCLGWYITHDPNLFQNQPGPSKNDGFDSLQSTIDLRSRLIPWGLGDMFCQFNKFRDFLEVKVCIEQIRVVFFDWWEISLNIKLRHLPLNRAPTKKRWWLKDDPFSSSEKKTACDENLGKFWFVCCGEYNLGNPTPPPPMHAIRPY